MTTDQCEFDLRQVAVMACTNDPSLIAQALREVERLQKSGENRLAVDVLEHLAEGMVEPNCPLPPLVRCHVFSRLGGMLAGVGAHDEGLRWLRRAVALADEAELSELSRRGFRRMLERLTERTASEPSSLSDMTLAAELEQETLLPIAASKETVAESARCPAEPRAAIGRLPDELRTLIELRFIQQLSADEIAERLGISRPELLQRLADARLEFHRALSQSTNQEDASAAPVSRSSDNALVSPRSE